MNESLLTKKDFIISRIGSAEFTNKRQGREQSYVADTDGVVFHAHAEDFANKQVADIPFLELAGPREKLFFNPAFTRIGIVTCGGLCPGLNSIIRAITTTAYQFYGVTQVVGFRNGYLGLNPESNLDPMTLTPDVVDNIHELGGTILGSSRGPQPIDTMVNTLIRERINILFVVGGDGTLRGGRDIAAEVQKRNLPIAIIGIPKTIDNDIALIERSFGFESAVAEANKAIHAAHTESKGSPNGIGLVKLMGRESGFIATAATLTSGVVNFCLVPEVPFSFEGLVAALKDRLIRRKHAVVVVAEGAGQDLVAMQGEDASGNKKLGDIGLFLRDALKDRFKKDGFSMSVKYIDPSYIIRSVPADADDNFFCLMLGQAAVHAAMSGRTDMVVAYRNDHFVHLPMALVTRERKRLAPDGRIWQTVLDTTNQPLMLG